MELYLQQAGAGMSYRLASNAIDYARAEAEKNSILSALNNRTLNRYRYKQVMHKVRLNERQNRTNA